MPTASTTRGVSARVCSSPFLRCADGATVTATSLAQESLRQHGFYVPQFEVRIEGVGLPRNVLRDVTQLTYRDNIKEIDGFELVVNNWDTTTRAFKYCGAETPADLKGSTRDSQRY